MMRTEGTFDYVWSLLVPRTVYIAVDATNMFGTTLLGIILAVALGATYFDFGLHISPLVIPATILISLSGTFVGYSMAFALPQPMMVQVSTQIIIFLVMLFSPIMYLVEQLPGWLQPIHQVLLLKYMAEFVRGTLTDLDVNLGLAFGVVRA